MCGIRQERGRMIESLLILLLGAFLIPVVGRRYAGMRDVLAAAVSFLSFAFALFQMPKILAGGIVYRVIWKAPPYGILIELDGLNALILLIVTFLGFLTVVYSHTYMRGRPRLNYYYTLLTLLQAGLVGMTITGDLFNLYVFFEIASISSYALVCYYLNRDALSGGTRYLIIGSLGTTIALLGIVFLYGVVGSLNMADIAAKVRLSENPLSGIALSFLFVGFAIKGAVFPLHTWKPSAISSAPLPIAALLSGGSSVVALYVMFRAMFTIFFTKAAAYALLFQTAGVLTMVFGAFFALKENNIKKMLAYSSISQIGYVLVAFSFSNYLGYFAGLFHLLNFAIAKVLLFFAAGVIIMQTGVKNLDELGGAAKQFPLTTFAFIIGALSITGIPLMNGFVSKWLIYMAGIGAGSFLVVAISLAVTAITIAYYAKAIATMFLGSPHKLGAVREPGRYIFAPILLLAFLCLLIGVYAESVLPLVDSATQSLTSVSGYMKVLR